MGATAVTLLFAAAALAWNHPSKGNQAAALKPERSTTQVQQAKSFWVRYAGIAPVNEETDPLACRVYRRLFGHCVNLRGDILQLLTAFFRIAIFFDSTKRIFPDSDVP
jgi:hypothetical protein